MWSLILVLASGLHINVNLSLPTTESAEQSYCMKQGELAAKAINAEVDGEFKVVSYGCRRIA